MEVWCVIDQQEYSCYAVGELIGVFDSKEKAQEFVSKTKKIEGDFKERIEKWEVL